MECFLLHGPKAEAHGRAEQLKQGLVQFGSIRLHLGFITLKRDVKSGGRTWTKFAGANLDMECFLLHGPKAEAHGRAEQLKQGLVQFGSILLTLGIIILERCKKWWPNLD